MQQLILNIPDKAYKRLKKAAEDVNTELFNGKDKEHALERVLEHELRQPGPFIEMLGWDNF